MVITIIILSVALAISVFVNINQLRKQEAQADYIEDLETSNTNFYSFFNTMKTKMGESYSRLKQVDRVGSFESDDETGFVFRELQDIIEQLNRDF